MAWDWLNMRHVEIKIQPEGDRHGNFICGRSQEPNAACPDQPKAAETHGFYSFGNIPVRTHTLKNSF